MDLAGSLPQQIVAGGPRVHLNIRAADQIVAYSAKAGDEAIWFEPLSISSVASDDGYSGYTRKAHAEAGTGPVMAHLSSDALPSIDIGDAQAGQISALSYSPWPSGLSIVDKSNHFQSALVYGSLAQNPASTHFTEQNLLEPHSLLLAILDEQWLSDELSELNK